MRWWALLLVVVVFGGASSVRAAAPAAKPDADVGPCRQGRTTEALGRYGAATDAYLKGLAKTATESCARQALARLDAQGRTCTTAKALEGLKRENEANAAYRKVLETLPRSRCALAGAKRTDGENFWTWATQASKDIGEALAALAVGLLAVALLVWAVLVFGTHVPGVRRLWPFRGFRLVRVRIDKLDDSAVAPTTYGASTTGLLRGRLRDDAADARVDQAAGSASALDGLAEVSSQAKIVVAFIRLLKALLPDRDWVVTGELQAKGGGGEGLSLAIENGRGFVDFGLFWQKVMGGPGEVAGPEAFRRLTVPAAGWLAHQVATANRPADRLSTDAYSWALTQCALYWYDEGGWDTAREFYERALGRDRNNIAALANLGSMTFEDGDWAGGADLLNAALELLEAP